MNYAKGSGARSAVKAKGKRLGSRVPDAWSPEGRL